MITNKSGLPEPLYKALCHDGYDSPKEDYDISVTSLISSPKLVQLKERYKDTVVEDACDRVWALLGHSVHHILQVIDDENSLKELRLYMEVEGWIITGQTDVYEKDSKVLSDYKVTTASSYAAALNSDMLTPHKWEAQLNLNAMLFRHHGYEVDKIQIVTIIKDWNKKKVNTVLHGQLYPSHPIKTIEYKLWSPDYVKLYASSKVKEHKAARDMQDDEIPACIPSERWFGDIRCKKYCQFSQFCSYAKNKQYI